MNDKTKAAYDAMIEQARLRDDTELVECLTEERDEKILASEVKTSEANTDRLIASAARGVAWGHWN
jgi:hypothetical protein